MDDVEDGIRFGIDSATRETVVGSKFAESSWLIDGRWSPMIEPRDRPSRFLEILEIRRVDACTRFLGLVVFFFFIFIFFIPLWIPWKMDEAPRQEIRLYDKREEK